MFRYLFERPKHLVEIPKSGNYTSLSIVYFSSIFIRLTTVEASEGILRKDLT